jgi:hypothetical protein
VPATDNVLDKFGVVGVLRVVMTAKELGNQPAYPITVISDVKSEQYATLAMSFGLTKENK